MSSDPAPSDRSALPPTVRPEALAAPESGIVEVFNYGRGREGLIPLWVGEGHLPTPGFISEAASKALTGGETFYTYQRGVPELRAALARYVARLHDVPVAPERFYVTTGGMQALMIAVRIISGPGDEVIIPSPAWPNIAGALAVQGATAVPVPMRFDPKEGWSLDVDRLAAAVTPRTRALFINSPANPTGWTATPDDLRAILALARRHGLWIVADEIYGRFAYGAGLVSTPMGDRAPSFRDVWEPDDAERILFVQTFSKNWAMTGWRVGWLEAPPRLGDLIENLIQYSTSGLPAFLQRGAVAAIEDGEAFVAEQVARAAAGRRIVVDGLSRVAVIDLPAPRGAFYAFLRVRGANDDRALSLRLVDEANVGLAPGKAFGPGGEGFQRLCFARSEADLEEAVRRIARVLGP